MCTMVQWSIWVFAIRPETPAGISLSISSITKSSLSALQIVSMVKQRTVSESINKSESLIKM